MNGEMDDSMVLEHLQELVLECEDMQSFLDAVVRLSVRELLRPEAEILCGITLLRDKKSKTVASNGGPALSVEEVQHVYDDGPGLDACRERATIHVPDLRRENRWPRYASDVLSSGIVSILAVPFTIEPAAAASLNLYAFAANTFTGAAIGRVERFVHQASNALNIAVRLAQHRDTEENLRAAMESRTVIDLAAGIIMGQNQCSQEQAIAILKSASSSRNIKLRDVAAGVIASVGVNAVSTHFDP